MTVLEAPPIENRTIPRALSWAGAARPIVCLAPMDGELGAAEKFLDIKCRKAGLKPDAVVLVATIRALKFHGGIAVKDLTTSNVEAVEKGMANLEKHVENLQKYGLPVVVAINSFTADTEEEVKAVQARCEKLGVQAVMSDHWARGGDGALDLAKATVAAADSGKADFKPIYPDDMSLMQKVTTVATEIYGARKVVVDKKLQDKFLRFEAEGYGHLPVCMAKTQYSFSTDPSLKGAPNGFDVPLRDAYVAAGAGFVVVLLGDIMTMPGLPRVPAGESIDINDDGEIIGLS